MNSLISAKSTTKMLFVLYPRNWSKSMIVLDCASVILLLICTGRFFSIRTFNLTSPVSIGSTTPLLFYPPSSSSSISPTNPFGCHFLSAPFKGFLFGSVSLFLNSGIADFSSSSSSGTTIFGSSIGSFYTSSFSLMIFIRWFIRVCSICFLCHLN